MTLYGNVFDFGFPTQEHEWSLTGKVKEYDNEDDTGKFIIRVCQNCFSTFEKSDICPYCGATYETTPIEIENFREIELKQIEEAKEERRQKFLNSVADKVKDYKGAKECQNWVELVEWTKLKRLSPSAMLMYSLNK